MKFYTYLENKFLFFENEIDYYYDLKNKKIYPIIKNKFYKELNEDPEEIIRKGTLPKLKNSNTYLTKSGINKNVKVLVKQNEPTSNSEIAEYIEVDGVYYPTLKIENTIGYLNEEGLFIEINLNDYKIKSKNITNYYVNLSKPKGSSTSIDSELSSLETPQEAPQEPPQQETK